MASATTQSSSRPAAKGSRNRRRRSESQIWLDELDAILNDEKSEDIEVLRKRLREQMSTARTALSQAVDTATDAANSYVNDLADCVDIYVETKPWHAIAYAAGAAFLAGVILSRR